jgi:two-component system response regulator RegA
MERMNDSPQGSADMPDVIVAASNLASTNATAPAATPLLRPLLLLDDDPTFVRVLARALGSRGFEVITATNFDEARALTRRHHPRYCVLDLKLGEENGLRLIPELHAMVPDIRVLLLTGYASIATAVEAIKRGAHDYLAKPVDADAVVRALLDGDNADGEESEPPDAPEAPLALRRLEWEHIQRVLTECDGNISETARRLGMHRRTLQRKLSKHPVRERPERDE